ncbi:PTS N,N'-diacetylchitobiose transporter subunit IIA [Aeromonas fluvialis]|uniref:PTS N,N'-diacetylchitobiose transporter subunit IIA n=1 Tax=Aeromonas fluvialis TaxID=591962 RepID=UPI000A016A7E|nr:PTS N,N'-diacetylchitobiose transporter subunit IIA [Aeromonas fluvialis]
MNFDELNIDDISPDSTEANKMDLEEQVMGIIINSGEARSCAYKALAFAKQGDFAQAEAKMEEARQAANAAHLVQTQLIEADMGEGKTTMTLIMVHAQDHLMTSMLARELVNELIDLHKKLAAQ